MMRRYRLLGIIVTIVVLAFLLLIVAAQDIADKQVAWERSGVEAYRLAVQDIGVWSIVNVELWVQEGRVQRLRADCQPGLVGLPCNLTLLAPRQYSVSGLFTRVTSAGDRLANVEYDPTYHFPSSIFEDDPQIYDDEHGLRVTAFEALPSGAASLDRFATSTEDVTAISTPAALPSARQAYPVALSPATLEGDINSWLDDATARWNALGVDSYWLTLAETTAWNGFELTMEVRDSALVRLEASCHPGWMRGPCDLSSLNASQYTIPALFERAREVAGVASAENDGLAFDTETGIPMRMIYNDATVFDEEWEIVVTQVAFLDVPAES
jgi:hypothetical protein